MSAILSDHLCQELAQALPEALRRCAPGTLLRLEVPIPGTDPLRWLAAQPEWTQYYWSSRDDDFEMAGIGEALVSQPTDEADLEAVFASLRRVLPPGNPQVRHYGGFRFHGGPVKGSRWQKFKEYRFVVPRVELCRRGGDCTFAYTHLVSEDDTEAAIEKQMAVDLDRVSLNAEGDNAPLPSFGDRADNPDEAGWEALVARTLQALESKNFEKIVLARETSFVADAPINSVALLTQLRSHQPGTFTFCFRPVADRAFLGASPERLYRRTGRNFETEALAGTRPRAKDPAEDARLRDALLASKKDRGEHAIVVDKILGHLQGLCARLEAADAPKLMRLENVQHLHTPLRGILAPAVSDGALIGALHPTPAVGGAPREAALEWIAQHEPFDRGIYAAPVGWVGEDAAEFCVAIRSGLVQNDTLTLYNGAGIVPASTPAEEWAEIEAKMAGFLDVMRKDAPE